MTLPPATRTRPGSDINHSLGTNGLIVVCKRDGFVEFHDAQNFALQEEIKLPDFPHEVVLSPDRKKAYVSIYGNGQVGTNTEPGTRIAVLDIPGKKLEGFIEVAPFLAPHAMMFDKAGLLWATANRATRSSISIRRAASFWVMSRPAPIARISWRRMPTARRYMCRIASFLSCR